MSILHLPFKFSGWSRFHPKQPSRKCRNSFLYNAMTGQKKQGLNSFFTGHSAIIRHNKCKKRKKGWKIGAGYRIMEMEPFALAIHRRAIRSGKERVHAVQNPNRRQSQQPYQNWQQPYVHKFPQNNVSGPAHPVSANNTPAANDDEPQKGRRRKARKEKKEKQRTTSIKLSVAWFVLGLIGLGTVLVQLARYVVIPLLVQLYDATGGA